MLSVNADRSRACDVLTPCKVSAIVHVSPFVSLLYLRGVFGPLSFFFKLLNVCGEKRPIPPRSSDVKELNEKLAKLINDNNLTKVDLMKVAGLTKRSLNYRLSGEKEFDSKEVTAINKLLTSKYTTDYLLELMPLGYISDPCKWSEESLRSYSERLNVVIEASKLNRPILEDRLGLSKGEISSVFKSTDKEKASSLLKSIEDNLESYFYLNTVKPAPVTVKQTTALNLDKGLPLNSDVWVKESTPLNLDGTQKPQAESNTRIEVKHKGFMDTFPLSLVKSVINYIRGWS